MLLIGWRGLSLRMDTQDASPPRWLKRILWLLVIGVGSVTALGIAAFSIRLVMRLLGA